jgi:hypothetical protein
MTTLHKSLLLITFVFSLGACHPDEGQSIADGKADGGTAPSPDAAAPTGPAGFLGTWQYIAGTGTTDFVCSDGTRFSGAAQGTETETFTAGAQANELVATDGSGCTETCVVSQGTATCQTVGACSGETISNDVYELGGGKLREVAVSGQIALSDGTTCQATELADGVLARAQ